MRSIKMFGILALAIFMPSVARADTLTYSQTVVLPTTGYAIAGQAGPAIFLPLFDPRWGKLQSATFTVVAGYDIKGFVDATAVKSGSAWNTGSWGVGSNFGGLMNDYVIVGTGDIFPTTETVAGSYSLLDAAAELSENIIYADPVVLMILSGINQSVEIDPLAYHSYTMEDLTSSGIRSQVAVTLHYSYSVSYSYLAAVPEPETWGMMIAGLGAVGVMSRRKRRRPSGASAICGN